MVIPLAVTFGWFSAVRLTIGTCRWRQQQTSLHADRPHNGNDASGVSLFRAAVAHFGAPPPYEVIKSMIRMIATALLVFWVPSVVFPLAQVQTSPFLTVNFFSF
jgi:hypothetical protein